MFRKLSVFLLTVLAAALLLSSTALAANSGKGENYTWEISDKTMTFTWTGNKPGPMPEDGFPWQYGDDYDGITSLVIGEGFTSVAAHAFDGLYFLQSVQLPQTLTEIGGCAFNECPVLTSVTIPQNCKTIGGSAFINCTSLSSVVFPENADLTIEDSAFEYCISLESVRILSGKNIVLGDKAFENARGLTSVVIEGESCAIGYNVFYKNYSLTSVTITGKSVSMGEAVFYDNPKLETVKVSLSSATRFGNTAFKFCTSLQTLYVQVVDDTAAEWNTKCYLPDVTTIIVQPNSKLDLMKEKWGAVANQITGIYQLKAQPCDNAVIAFPEPDVFERRMAYIDVRADPGYEVRSVTYDIGEGDEPAEIIAGSAYYQFNTRIPTVDVINIKAVVEKALSVVKSEAAIELKAWAGKNPSDKVAAILNQYLAKIDAASTASEVERILKAGKDEISTLQEAEAARKEAVKVLKAWAGDEPSKAISAVLKKYTAKLKTAENVSKIAQLLQDGKDEIGTLQTLDEHKAAAIREMELRAGNSPSASVRKIVEQYTAKINAAATAAKVDQLLTAAEKAIRTKEKSTIQSVAMNKIQKTLYARKDGKQRDTLQLKVQLTPAKAEYGKITWKSSRPEVAKVNAKGLVTALKPGTTKITATIKEGDRKWTAACKIVVKKKDAKVTGISAKPKTLTLKKGQKGSVRLTFKPAGVYNNKVKWTTSDKKIATVSADGVITARKKGSCIVTATAADGSGMKVTIKVTVK